MKVDITSEGPGWSTEVFLDGKQIIPTGVDVHITHDELVRVVLDVDVIEGANISLEDPIIIIPDYTKDLLVKLGWTPPNE